MSTEDTVNDMKKTARRVVLVGTYKGDQLANWPGWYCRPLAWEIVE